MEELTLRGSCYVEHHNKVMNVEESDHSRVRKIDWLDMPEDVMALITHMLLNLKDYIRFGGVCRAWRSVYVDNLHRRRLLPYLLIPPPAHEQDDDDGQTRRLYCLQEKGIVPGVKLEVPHNEFCRGSSHGWLVTLHENLSDIRLLNPFLSTQNVIHLPPLTSFCDIRNESFFTKAVLSASPTLDPNYTVMAIYGEFRSLAFFKPGDKTWTLLHDKRQLFEDVIYHNNQFYVLDSYGTVYTCDVNCPRPKLKKLTPRPKGTYWRCLKKYLVDLSGELLRVGRDKHVTKDQESYYTCGFDISKLNHSDSTWSPVKSLGCHALFLGDNNSIALSSPGCKPNCIYFTDDDSEWYHGEGDGPHDLGVFHLDDGRIEPHYVAESRIIVPSPIWIQPTILPT